MDNRGIAEDIKTYMSEYRYKHTLGVAETAVKLARAFGADPEKAEAAALLHDTARDSSPEQLFKMCEKYSIAPDEIEMLVPDLLHGAVAARIAETKYNIGDREILDAIKYHTTGRKNMSVLDKIIFIADMIEPGRDFPGVAELRQSALEDLDKAVIRGLESTIRFVLERGYLIHPNTIEARNDLLKNPMQKELGETRRI